MTTEALFTNGPLFSHGPNLTSLLNFTPAATFETSCKPPSSRKIAFHGSARLAWTLLEMHQSRSEFTLAVFHVKCGDVVRVVLSGHE